MKVGAVIVAAGRGIRAGGGTPKQWRMLAGSTVAEHSIAAFVRHPGVSSVVLVVNPLDLGSDDLPETDGFVIASGGDTRSASVLAGLQALENDVDIALIHDAARPCVSATVIDAVVEALSSSRGAAPAVAVVDALWTGQDGRVTGTANRDGLFRAQTPQGFYRDEIIEAHLATPKGAADDVEVARRAGIEVAIVTGDEDNLKITVPADFARAEAILGTRNGY